MYVSVKRRDLGTKKIYIKHAVNLHSDFKNPQRDKLLTDLEKFSRLFLVEIKFFYPRLRERKKGKKKKAKTAFQILVRLIT